MKQATLWTVRTDRKIKGFPQTHENKAGDVVQLVRTLPCHRHHFFTPTSNPEFTLYRRYQFTIHSD